MNFKYKMSAEEYKELIKAAKPVPYLIMGGKEPPSPKDKAHVVWRRIAERFKVKYDSITDARSGNPREFYAEPLEEA